MTPVSKYVYIDKIDEIVNKYNNTYHNKIKIKPVDVKLNIYIAFNKWINEKYPKFKISDHVRKVKYKIFAKGYTQNWRKSFWNVLFKKKCKKQIKKSLQQKKWLREKVINYILNRKAIINHSIVWLIRKYIV